MTKIKFIRQGVHTKITRSWLVFMENEKEAFDEIKFDWSNQDINWYGEQYNSGNKKIQKIIGKKFSKLQQIKKAYEDNFKEIKKMLDEHKKGANQ